MNADNYTTYAGGQKKEYVTHALTTFVELQYAASSTRSELCSKKERKETRKIEDWMRLSVVYLIGKCMNRNCFHELLLESCYWRSMSYSS